MCLLRSCKLARQYEEDKKYQGDVDQMIASMINWESTKNFSSGFIFSHRRGCRVYFRFTVGDIAMAARLACGNCCALQLQMTIKYARRYY